MKSNRKSSIISALFYAIKLLPFLWLPIFVCVHFILNSHYQSIYRSAEQQSGGIHGSRGEIIQGAYRSSKSIGFSESFNWGTEASQNQLSLFEIIRSKNADNTESLPDNIKPNEIMWVFAERVSPRSLRGGGTFYKNGIVRGKTESSVSDGIVIIDMIEIEKTAFEGSIIDVIRLTGNIGWRFFQWGIMKGDASTSWRNSRLANGWSPTMSRVTDITNPSPFIIFLFLFFIIFFINKKYFRDENVSTFPGGDSPESPLR